LVDGPKWNKGKGAPGTSACTLVDDEAAEEIVPKEFASKAAAAIGETSACTSTVTKPSPSKLDWSPSSPSAMPAACASVLVGGSASTAAAAEEVSAVVVRLKKSAGSEAWQPWSAEHTWPGKAHWSGARLMDQPVRQWQVVRRQAEHQRFKYRGCT